MSKYKNIGILAGSVTLAIGTALILNSCNTIPKGVSAVKPFDKDKYLGKWYEIARLDFRFEKDMNNTTAEYSLNKDGSIKVVNRGYNYKKGEEKEATGKAKFVDSADEAKLKVSFFGPFYAGYNVIDIDKDYKYALVAGKNFNYLWLLSRETTMPEKIKESYLQKAQDLGYDTSKLVWVEHNRKSDK
ncbi:MULTISPECIES: lipocalin family protein [unclassified Dysgonomonas]|uniref:lipocalin family protein n=1 Tax=unclassified Dysgonomonas TaxID=2630389 RepID=UPI0013ECA307|nr:MULTISPECIES: lipocalin family protein [unclassified Dysgonomonas]